MINRVLPRPEMRTWLYGIAGTLFNIAAEILLLGVRSVLSAWLHLPICALELKEEGVAVLNVRSFHAKTRFIDLFTDEHQIDCNCCGDGPAELVFPMEYRDSEQCRNCDWCMPLCTRCMRVNGLQHHCALCLGDDEWNTMNDAEGLRRHWDLMDVGGREWCRNIVRLHDAADALEQEG